MPTRLVHVVVDAVDVERLARFWSAALDWHLAEEYLRHGEGVVRAGDGSGLEVVVVPTPEPKTVKNRVHLDVNTVSAEDRAALTDRLLRAGATPADIGQGDVPWTVLADPEGNEFCILEDRDDPAGRLAQIAFDAEDVDAQAGFWTEATGWTVETEESWGLRLRHPSGSGPALAMGPPVAPKAGKARVHLDVAPFPDGDLQAEVARLVTLGAQPVDVGQGDVPWTVLADPEGNEFCVLTPR